MKTLFILHSALNTLLSVDLPAPSLEKILGPFYDYLKYNNLQSIQFLGNSIVDYIIFALIFVVSLLLLKPLLKLIISIFRKIASKTPSDIDNKIVDYFSSKANKSLVSLEFVIALYLSLKTLSLSPTILQIVNGGAIILVTIFIVSIIIDVIKFIIKSKYSSVGDPRGNSLLLIFPIIKIVIWILAIFFILSNLGYDVSALLAGLGIGGVALALASQSFLGDLLSFISIVSDKPIEIGDYISINGIEGMVKKIGIKSTRIERNLGEEVIIPNSKITGSDLFNYKRLEKRRFDIVFGIEMNTPNEKLKLVPEIVNKIIAENEIYELVRCTLDTITNFSYNFTAIVYVLDPNGLVYFQLKEAFIYKVRTELEQNGIYFAYPKMEIIEKN